eukprot:jgi/Mesen1/2595/ME000165S01857
MGNSNSQASPSEKGADEDEGVQLYVTVKLHEVHQLPSGLFPYLYGAPSLIGAWDASKAVALVRESSTVWEVSFVVPARHDPVELKFLLKPPSGGGDHLPCIPETGPTRIFSRGQFDEASGHKAVFLPLAKEGKEAAAAAGGEGGAAAQQGAPQPLQEFAVSAHQHSVSPFTLAASWKAQAKALSSLGSFSRAYHDVSLSSTPPDSPQMTAREQGPLTVSQAGARYEVPLPPTSPALLGSSYAADLTEEPRMLRSTSAPLTAKHLERPARVASLSAAAAAHNANSSQMRSAVSIKDLVLLGEEAQKSEEVEAQKQSRSRFSGSPPPPLSTEAEGGDAGVLVDATPSPVPQAVVRAANEAGHSLAESAGSSLASSQGVLAAHEDMPEAAGAVAAAAAAERMLGPKERRRLAIVLVGLPARGKTFTAAKLARYLRWLGHDTRHFNVGKLSDFFRPDNPEGVEARKEVAVLAWQDMLAWMDEGGQVGVFDATNSTRERRNMLMQLADGKCKLIFLETICNDPAVLEDNIREKVKKSPDYAHEPDQEVAIADFKTRLANYEKVYEPVSEGSYIKLIDMVSNISGYLPGRIVSFLVNTHIVPRPIFLTRHGESGDNVRARIGGDPALRLDREDTASIWTSTLQRTLLTARHIHGFPKVQWRALDEINAGICDGMTYLEIKQTMPDEYQARKLDKLRYRYPRGESYLDVIQRRLVRARMPLHTIIELSTGVGGITEKRFRLLDANGAH